MYKKNICLPFLILFFLIISCNINNESKKSVTKKFEIIKSNKENKKNTSYLKKHNKKYEITQDSTLVDIKTIDESIQVDLKYASNDNFMKQRLYFHTNKLLIQKDVAIKLSKVQSYLKSINSNYSLLIYDGARPLSVQQKMWKALDSIPISLRTKFVSNPANGSIHNYGAAVDLTICDENKIPLDMGANYDDIREIAYPKLELYFLKKGELKIEHIENRKLLRKVMNSQGFINIPTEWWHFNSCSRNEAKKKYKLMK